ncbi:MAG: MCE family protein, partial [Nitrospirota bacterium]
LIVLSFMTFSVGGFDWLKKEGYTVYVHFEDISGLDENTKAKIAGVDAGNIETITLDGGRAKLTIRMFPGIDLYSDASASVNSTGLLGDKFLAIKPGSAEPKLQDGDEIKNVDEMVSLDAMARKLTEISQSVTGFMDNLNDILGSDESKESLKQTIRNLRSITSNLNKAIASNDEKLNKVLDSVTKLADSMQKVIEENSESLKSTVANIEEFSGSIKEITEKIEKGEGTLGKLVHDDKLFTTVSNAAEGLERTVSSVERFRTFITFQGEYLTKPEDGKGYFYLTLQPRENTYYILGAVGDPTGSVSTRTTTTTTIPPGTTIVEETQKVDSRAIEITAMYGKRFLDTIARVGLIENTFGVGVDQFFYNDKVKLSLDAWDFSGEHEGADNPHVKVGADYYYYKRLFLSLGYDNIFNENRAGLFVGTGIRFEDEDFKYLLGTIGP